MSISKNDYLTNIRKIHDYETGGWLVLFINKLLDMESIDCKKVHFVNCFSKVKSDNEFFINADGIIYRLKINNVGVLLGSEIDEIEDKCLLGINYEFCKRDFVDGKSSYKIISSGVGSLILYIDDLM